MRRILPLLTFVLATAVTAPSGAVPVDAARALRTGTALAPKVAAAASMAGYRVATPPVSAPVDVLADIRATVAQARELQLRALRAMTPARWALAQDGAAATVGERDAWQQPSRWARIQAGLDALEIDHAAQWQATVLLAGLADRMAVAARRGKLNTGVTPTPLGEIIIDTGPAPCDDIYEAAALIIIENCGSDQYHSPAAGADGTSLTPISIVVDLVGRDHAFAADHTPSIGGATNGGIAIALDSAGHDNWGHGSGGMIGGAGKLGGIGVMYDVFGDDAYDASGFHSPGKWGAGHFSGSGVLIDHNGNDRYSGDTFEEGSGWFGDAFGLLADLSGNDSYLDISTYSIGSGGVGGVGMLLDYNGHDSYVGFSYQQVGVGACGGIGLVADVQGNDVYSAPMEGVAAADATQFACDDEFGAGLVERLVALLPEELTALLPESVRDRLYGLENQTILAVGALIDGSGTDEYAGWDEESTIAAALGESLALLFDGAGTDSYQHGIEDKKGVQRRGDGGIGIDLNR